MVDENRYGFSRQRYYQKDSFRHNRPNKPWKTQRFQSSEDGDPFGGPAPVSKHRLHKYERGKQLDTRGMKTLSSKKQMVCKDKKTLNAIEQTARSELLLLEDSGFLEAEEGEQTHTIHQSEIVASVDITSATKRFDLTLNQFGPYTMDYSRDGRYLLLGGHRGHVATFDWVTKRLLCEINVMESVHDVHWLHMPTMYAVAQKSWVYIYDTQGVELHCIKKLNNVLKLEFLPYHFLLAASHDTGFLSWLDVSIGKMITQFNSKLGRLGIMCQNPYNATLVTGHTNGTVSLWSPNVNEPLAKMLCHPHPVRAVAVDKRGQYLSTCSVDRTLKIWDLRTYKLLQSYRFRSPPSQLNISQKDLLAVSLGNMVEVYQSCCTETVTAPYLRHWLPSTITDMAFCPYEDVLGIGHNSGFSSILVPGSGEPNFDALECNPFMTKSQRREMEVKALLEKIQPEMISLDPTRLAHIDVTTRGNKLAQNKLVPNKLPKIELKKKMKRKSSSLKLVQKKKGIQENARKSLIKASIKQKGDNKKPPASNVDVLQRFKPKS